MAHATTSVTSTLPAVGLFPVAIPAGQPTIQVLEIEETNNFLIAYDRDTWTPEQIHGLAGLRFGAYETVDMPARGGA